MNKLLKTLDKSFLNLHQNSCEIIKKTPSEKLFWKPIETYSIFSCGEFVLRSAGKVEQTFGGITTRLWDDPFEWTLPEELSTNEKILSYLDEVETTRINGFKFFNSDTDLKKEIPTPVDVKSIFQLLIDTLSKAENMQGRAISILQMIESK